MLNPSIIRPNFPSLTRTLNGRPLVFFDAPAGTQVSRSCIEAVTDYFMRCNANTHGTFVTSVESDAIIAGAHEAMADFLNAPDADDVIFGPNMTTLTFALSRSIGQWLKPGDEIILTKLDHDANFSPWKLMADERGVIIRSVDVNVDDCTLVVDDFERYLSPKTRLVAVGGVSNAVGTINPIKQIVGMAKAAGAMTFVDAVAYAPHVPIDVQDLGTDFLACSTYKFFAPHQGVIYGRKELLEQLPAYKVRPATSELPGKFETGTQSMEMQAGVIGAIEYLDGLHAGLPLAGEAHHGHRSARATRLHRVMHTVRDYEKEFSRHMLEGLRAIKGVQIYGITDPARLDQRVPTFAIRVEGEHPHATATRLGKEGVLVWDGNYYALNLTEKLGVEHTGGMVRIGLVHYATHEEIDRLLNVLAG